MNHGEAKRKDTFALAMMALVLAFPTIIFTVVADAPQTAAVVLFGLAVSASLRKPLIRSTRTYVYTMLAALVATVGQHQFLPANADRFFLMPGDIYCPMLLYLAVSLTLFEARDSVVASVVSLAVLTTMIAGNVLSIHTQSPTFLNVISTPEEFHRLYGIIVAGQALAIVLLLGRCVRQRAQDTKQKRDRLTRTAVFTACVILVLVAALAMRSGAIQFQRRFQEAISDLLQRYVRNRATRTVFSREVDLWRTARLRSRQDQTIVLRVRAKRFPGYLRGYVYRDYENGRWRADEPGPPLHPASAKSDHITFHVFERASPPQADQADRLDMLPASDFQSQVLLAPGDTAQVELICPELRNSPDGEMTPGKWDTRTGYVLVAPRYPTGFAYPGPAGKELDAEAYLGVPDGLAPHLQAVADEVFVDLPEGASTDATVAALIGHLRQNFQYELGVRMKPGAGDPVLQFLTRWRRGHCELFAASTTLLLRMRGIPTRYVTGFMCAEQPAGGRYYLSRLQDAHAWVEAYDSDLGYWVLVEPTPASGVPTGHSDTSLLWSLMDSLRLAWQQMLALMKRGYIARALAALFTGIGACILAIFAHPGRATVAVGALAALLYWLVCRAQRRRRAEAKELGEGRWLLRRGRKRLLRQFLNAGVSPAPSDSFRHLLARLAHSNASQAALLAPAIGEYERLRYGPKQPSTEEIKAFEERIRETRNPRPRP